MRINVIPIIYLTDAHLRAEYREILMSCHYYRKSANSTKGIQRHKIPEQYTLNKGHAMFFYNKMGYVRDRHTLLENEMIRRGFKIRQDYSLRLDWVLPQDMNDYEITREDIWINIERVLLRISEMEIGKGKAGFYKLLGCAKSFESWCTFYQDVLTNFK